MATLLKNKFTEKLIYPPSSDWIRNEIPWIPAGNLGPIDRHPGTRFVTMESELKKYQVHYHFSKNRI